MKSTLFFLLLAVEIALVWWGITNRKGGIRIVSTIAAVLLALLIGFSIAWGWAALVNYDQYVWRFSQYSGFIRGLA
jgi:NADH:ubiquinone oxidoreductase subunit 3 (subunit A)